MSADWHCITPFAEAARQIELSLNNRGLAYGDGFFTTMRVSGGEIRWYKDHLQRIRSHAKALSLNIDEAALMALASQLSHHAQQLGEGVMKLIITRAPQAHRGYGFETRSEGSDWEGWLSEQPDQNAEPSFPSTSPLADHSSAQSPSHSNSLADTLVLPDATIVPVQSPIHAVCLTSQVACLPPTLAGLKTLNRLDNVLASAELQRLKSDWLSTTDPKHADSKNNATLPTEGLVKDMSGVWVEGTMSNVFYQLTNSAQHDQWFTPPIDRSGVKGILRGVIMRAFVSSKRPILERRLGDEDLLQISKMFFCNAVRGVMPVKTLRVGDRIELLSCNLLV